MNVTTIGIDLAKNTFSLHGVDSRGKMLFRKTLSRTKLLPFLAQQPPCLIGMEAFRRPLLGPGVDQARSPRRDHGAEVRGRLPPGRQER